MEVEVKVCWFFDASIVMMYTFYLIYPSLDHLYHHLVLKSSAFHLFVRISPQSMRKYQRNCPSACFFSESEPQSDQVRVYEVIDQGRHNVVQLKAQAFSVLRSASLNMEKFTASFCRLDFLLVWGYTMHMGIRNISPSNIH